MAGASASSPLKPNRLERVGYGLILAFILFSTIHVHLRQRPALLDPDVQQITLAHWFLEEGVRDGFDEVIRRFEAMKAEQGIQVKVVQSTIPSRGYKQWFITQLVGGNPADVIAMHWQVNSGFKNKYFVPLSPYTAQPNPFNRGTPLEGMSWRDSYVDGMQYLVDPVYAEQYVVSWAFNVYRLFVNVDLLAKATGDPSPPRTYNEFIEDCRLIQAYAERMGEPILPIATRGTDRGTLRTFTDTYFSQMNGHYNDQSLSGRARIRELVHALNGVPDERDRQLAIVDLMTELGQYFGEGFPAMDKEQAMFMYFSGKACFYFSGTWAAKAMVDLTPFEVRIIRIPPIGEGNRFSKYFTGPISESGFGASNGFAIPKSCPNRELAIELLQFMTSYEMDQLVMQHCHWLPIVKEARYSPLQQQFAPEMDGNMLVPMPFSVTQGGVSGLASDRKWMETLEEILLQQPPDGPGYFLDQLKSRRDMLLFEVDEVLKSYNRSNLDRERERSQLAIGLLAADPSTEDTASLRERQRFDLESYYSGSGKYTQFREFMRLREEFEQF